MLLDEFGWQNHDSNAADVYPPRQKIQKCSLQGTPYSVHQAANAPIMIIVRKKVRSNFKPMTSASYLVIGIST